MGKSRLTFAKDHDACGVGFITQLGAVPSHGIVERGLVALSRLAHRGGVDADGRSGDGAGLLVSLPKTFFLKTARADGIELPEEFGVGMVFLQRGCEKQTVESIRASVAKFDLAFLGWREVPTTPSILGPRSSDSLPVVRQCFLAPAKAASGKTSKGKSSSSESSDFESRLFLLRQELEAISDCAYYCSLSSRTIVYKGLLTPEQLAPFYPDLDDPEFEAAFVVFHQRYSTNTQPSWSLAQPFRFVAHNGEINTISSNRRWFQARSAKLRQQLGLSRQARLLQPGMSDSASVDNALEAYVRAGFSTPEALLRLVPPAWEHDEDLDAGLHQYLANSAPEQEPWDGPAALIFTDGQIVGAKLDRNGLRPMRYTLTSDGLLIVGSEVGITDLSNKDVVERQRLGPGEMLVADPESGTFFRPSEIARLVRAEECEPVTLVSTTKPSFSEQVPAEACPTEAVPEANRLLAAFGWTEDQYRMLFQPLVEHGQEPLWSMGDDAPPAFLSSLPRSLWDFCKQRFAQVTNPPIDPLRESHVMSLDVYLGKYLKLSSPLLDAGQMRSVSEACPPMHVIDFTFEATDIEAGLQALRRIRKEATTAVASCASILLTDRGVNTQRAAVPALLAVSAAWQAMTDAGGWNIPLVVESGQVSDTHHVALLIAAGASAVHPYLAISLAARGDGETQCDGPRRYAAAIEKGLRKVLARMGISTISSYRNSQLFETIGLDAALCEEFFADAGHSLSGTTLSDLLQDCVTRHAAGFGLGGAEFRDAGLYRFRHNGELHANSPELVRRMHRYIKSPTEENRAAFAMLSDQRKDIAVRDLLEIRAGGAPPLPLNEVESEASLLSRFSTQAMSLGAISPETHQTLAIAMNRLGGRSNTGEGGEDPNIYYDRPEANNRVKQVASARFGVTAEYLVHAGEIEIKMAQGSKPGEGGQLPSAKVTPYIARLRHAIPGTSLISPPPHHDIYSIEDLAQLIYDLRAVNPNARIGVKLVSSSGVGVIATGVAKAGADVITIAGHDGGTGASPLTSIKNTGLPWEIGLRDAHTALMMAGMRGRVRLRVDGGLKFARDVVVAALLGAEEFGFGTAALLAVGCVMARQCHLNTCPVGIATQDEKLRARFAGSPEMVETFFRALVADVREMLAGMGARSIDEIQGEVRRLQPRSPEAQASIASLLQPVLNPPDQFFCPHEDASALHVELNRVVDDLESLSIRPYSFAITNEDRAVGARFSGEVLRRLGASFGLSNMEMSGVDCEFQGTAGQSFGAFLISGANFRLTGEANDYVGKGLCGGSIAISAKAEASERGDVLVGNTVLYGATSGELYVAGRAGERFAVRNSGALAVVEGVGRHGCEYMTAGVVLILGPAGVNLGAGMTGGLVYLACDEADANLEGGTRHQQLNHDSVQYSTLAPEEEQWLRRVLYRHVQLTGSPRAADMLASTTLPLLRVEPLQPPCPIEETWAPVLSRVTAQEARSYGRDKVLTPERPVVQ